MLVPAFLGVIVFVDVSVAGFATEPPLIVGGSNADRGEYPWQVLLKEDGKGVCGGSLIRDNVVLTAAHCIYFPGAPRRYKVVLGEYSLSKNDSTEQIIVVANITRHEDFNGNLRNDIALLVLETNATLDKYVQLISLPEDKKMEKKAKKTKANCWVSGWGEVDEGAKEVPDVLQELKTKVVGPASCRGIIDKRVTSGMICGINTDSGVCFGDSGSAMGCHIADDFFQIGIVSWGVGKCHKGKQVYTRVYKYMKWINNNMP